MWNLIQRYISGRSTAEENEILEKWMRKDPANREIVEELKRIWESAPEEDFDVNVEQAWDRFQKERMKDGKASVLRADHAKKENSKMVWFRAAAVLLLATFVGFFSWHYIQKQYAEQKQSYAMQKLVTQKGEKAQVTFSDGTKVTLNVASSLQFPKAFAGSQREVYLDGEAFFEVTHNKSKPFIVHTQNADIKVLGTKFNIQAWKEDKKTEVGVAEGRVSLMLPRKTQNADKPTVLLGRGEYATAANRHLSPVRRGDISNMILWLGGGLYFNDTPFSTVVRQIERKFDIDITVRNSGLKDVPFTGTFKNAGLHEVLQVVATSMGIKYGKSKTGIIFY